MKKNFAFVCLTICLFAAVNKVSAQRVMVTWAGNGVSGYNGDNLPGYRTEISGVNDVCVDADHNIYFTDQVNNRVRKISASNGEVSTVASVASPKYMCISPAGIIYVTVGSQVKQINLTTGTVSLVAGGTTSGFSGDGGAATAAQLNNPQGICIDDAGNLIFADCDNNRIRKIDMTTGFISTICGAGIVGYTGDGGSATDAELSGPVAVSVDHSGNVFFSDQVGTVVSYIREINAATGNIATIAGTGGMASGDGGPALSAGLGGIYGMCCDDSGNVIICDVSCSCREINMSTGIINTVAGSLTADGYGGDGLNALSGELNWPYGVFKDHTGSLYIADKSNSRIRKAIQLSTAPAFAFGKGQMVYACPGTGLPLSNVLSIADMDAGQMETWSVVSNPANGFLSGFPYSQLSAGTVGLSYPGGLQYTSVGGFTGPDSFQVMVTDGTSFDTITVFVKVGVPTPSAITGTLTTCQGSTPTSLACAGGSTDSSAYGIWSASNGSATVGSDGTVTANYAGTDTIFYTYTDICTVTSSAVYTIHPVPDAGTITGIPTTSIGSTTTLSESVSGGTWVSYSPAIATVSGTGVVTGLSLGVAVIEYKVTAAGCTSTASDPVTVSTDTITTAVLAINTNQAGIRITPNPVKNTASIFVNSLQDEPVTISIVNVLGEKVGSFVVMSNEVTKLTLELPSGVYNLIAVGQHFRSDSRFVKD